MEEQVTIDEGFARQREGRRGLATLYARHIQVISPGAWVPNAASVTITATDASGKVLAQMQR